ncbi:MAG: DUF885 domain-containing protein [Myxococcota bacterium]|nr:DUF885 domain-containing protein [Myxococcota bacterium]
MRVHWLFATLLLTSCATTSTPKKAHTPKQDSAAGVSNPELKSLITRHWTWTMKSSPTWATQLGITDYNDKISDNSFSALKKHDEERRQFLKEAQNISRDALSDEDQITHTLFSEFLTNQVNAEACRFSEWSINPRSNPITSWNYLATLHKVQNDQDANDLLARYKQVSQSIDNEIENLARGAQDGLFANAESTNRVIEMVQKQLAQDLSDWPLMAPTKKAYTHSSTATWNSFRKEMTLVVSEQIKPALQRYHDALKQTVLPKARDNTKPGLASLPLGEKCYAARVTNYTNLTKSPQEIHDIGLREIAKINTEMKALGNKLFGTDELSEILQRLRTDTKLYFDTEKEVEEKARSALARAQAAMPKYFGIVPQAPCVVTRIPDYEAPYTTIAYYRAPNPDGSKPGEYFINVYKPKTRPRYEAEALAFHEAIPGHHLQIAIGQELPALPLFRKHFGMTAFVEGWALYTERLSDEMGLYTADLDRMGMLSYDSWRAARLVVDTGLHQLGWSREQAVQYMLKHTALAENNIRNEVDRYITWPGQALGYKIGQLEFFKLRRMAKEQLKDKFDIRKFHDTVLSAGAVNLSIVKTRVQDWIEQSSQEN